MTGKKTLSDLAKSADAPELADIAAAVASGTPGRVETRDAFTGKDVVMSWAPVEHGSWAFVAVAPKAEILAEANALRTLLLVLGLAVLLVVAATVALVARRLAKPIVQVTDAAEKVARGEVDVTVDATGEDEVGRMAGGPPRSPAAPLRRAGSRRRRPRTQSRR